MWQRQAPAPTLPDVSTTAGTTGPTLPCVCFVLQMLLEWRALGGGLCMELYLRFHRAKTLTGNCKNRTGKLKKVLPLLFPLNMFFQHLECLAL